MFMAADEFPLPYEYRHMDFEGVLTRAARRLQRAHGRLPRLRQHRPHAGRLPAAGATLHILNIDHHHDNTRFGTVNLVVPDASCTAEIVWDLAKDLGVELTPRDRRRALRRRWSPTPGKFHVREHHRRGAPHGRRADRARRRRPRGLPAPLRGPAVRPAAAARTRAGARRALRRRRAHASPTSRATTTRRRARTRPTPRASSTTCAPSRARSPALVRELLSDDRDGRAQGQPARHRRPRRRLARSRARTAAAGTARRPASPPSSRYDELVERSCARGRAHSSERRDRGPVGRPARREAGGSHVARRRRATSAAPRGRGARKVGHAGTLDPFATGLLLVLVGRATRAQRFLMALPKTYRAVARLGWTSDTGDPRGRADRRPAACRSGSSCPTGEHAASARRRTRR